MEIDFDFELSADSEQTTADMGVHCLNESWFLYLRDDDHKIITRTTPPCTKDDERFDRVFTHSDLNIFGTIPILESFSALSCIVVPPMDNYHTISSTSSTSCSSASSTTNDGSIGYNNVMTCLEIPSYTGTSSPAKSSRKRPLINYSESEHDSAFSSHSPSTASSSSYNQDLDTTITDISTPTSLSEKSSSSSSLSSTFSKKRFQSSSSPSSSKRSNITISSSTTSSIHTTIHTQVVERAKATSTIVNPRLSRSQTKETINLPQIENKQSPCDSLTEPVEPTACRTRTELIALKGSTPTIEILPDAVPTVVDTLLETAGSPTKPTDEPALPDDDNDIKPFLLENTQIEQTPSSTTTTPPVKLINISVDELSIDKLKLKHPALFSHQEDEETKPVKKFVKYDPFITETDIICDDDNLEPKRKIVKFKYSPFESSTESSNLFIMELEETIDSPQNLPCGVYEIESTKPYYRIKPDPGIYETNDLEDDNNWKLTKLTTFDFDIEQEETAPPTPQTPVCMKRVHTDEELTFVNMFSGLYDIETAATLVTPDDTADNVCILPPLNGIQFRQLVTKPRARSKVGNTITPNLLQDFQMNTTLRQTPRGPVNGNNNNISQLRNTSQMRP